MRLLKSQIEQKTGAGFATLLPEEPEDMVSKENASVYVCVRIVHPLTTSPVARIQPHPRERPHTRKGRPQSHQNL
jgi:hypothetical protein